MTFNKTKQWAKDKPLFPASISILLASLANQLYNFIEHVLSDSEFKSTLRVRDPQKWVSFYRKHHQIYRALFEHFLPNIIKVIPKTTTTEMILYGLNATPAERLELRTKLDQLNEVEVQNFVSEVRTLITKLLNNVLAEVGKDEPTESKKLKQWRSISTVPEVLFFFRVWLPCFFLYAVHPAHLMHTARLGDINAIEKLLWLDKNAIQESKIAQIFENASAETDNEYFRSMVTALKVIPPKRFSEEKIKISIAGLITLVFESFGCKILKPEIRRLFNNLAYDVDGLVNDPDLELIEEDNFRTRVNIQRKFWLSLFKRTSHKN